MTTVYKEDRERFIGYIESSAGMGLLLGPLMGAGLYSVGGYMLPFAILALSYFVMYPLIMVVLFKLRKFENESPPKEKHDKDKVSQLRLLLNARFFFGMSSQITIFIALTFLMPTLAVHLQELGFPDYFGGVCFAIPTFAYVVASTFVYKLTQTF